MAENRDSRLTVPPVCCTLQKKKKRKKNLRNRRYSRYAGTPSKFGRFPVQKRGLFVPDVYRHDIQDGTLFSVGYRRLKLFFCIFFFLESRT